MAGQGAIYVRGLIQLEAEDNDDISDIEENYESSNDKEDFSASVRGVEMAGNFRPPSDLQHSQSLQKKQLLTSARKISNHP